MHIRDFNTKSFQKQGGGSVALGVSFRFFDHQYCIINSQFSSGPNPKLRNQEYTDVLEGLEFDKAYKIDEHE